MEGRRKAQRRTLVSITAKIKELGNKGDCHWLWLKIKAWRWLWFSQLLVESSRKRLFFTILMALGAASKDPKLQKESNSQ